MGIDSCAKLKGRVRGEELHKFICETFDKNAVFYPCQQYDYEEPPVVYERYDNSGRWKIDSGFIVFKDKDENERRLFYCYNNINCYENMAYYKPLGLEDMVKAETTYVSLRKWGSAVDIIRAVAVHFSGWLDEDDSDNQEYHWVEKTPYPG